MPYTRIVSPLHYFIIVWWCWYISTISCSYFRWRSIKIKWRKPNGVHFEHTIDFLKGANTHIWNGNDGVYIRWNDDRHNTHIPYRYFVDCPSNNSRVCHHTIYMLICPFSIHIYVFFFGILMLSPFLNITLHHINIFYLCVKNGTY